MKKISILVASLLLFCIMFSGCSKNGIKKKDLGGTVALKITCQDAVDYKDLDSSIKLPKDGIYYDKDKVKFAKGDSVKDLLEREFPEKKSEIEFTEYNTIKSIGDLKSKDCGNESGWACYINDKYIAFSYDTVEIDDGDTIEIAYYTSYRDMMKR